MVSFLLSNVSRFLFHGSHALHARLHRQHPRSRRGLLNAEFHERGVAALQRVKSRCSTT
jgi:hypothetical protein